MGPRNHVLDGGPDPHGKGQFLGKGHPGKVQGLFAVSCAKTAEPIDLRFRLWTRVGGRKHKFNRGANVPSWEGTLAPPGEYD